MVTIVWKGAGHKQRFLEAIREINKIDPDGSIDVYYGAAVYMLSFDEHVWSQAKHYISEHGIKFVEMINNMDLTSGSKYIVYVAATIFNQELNKDLGMSPGEIPAQAREDEYQLAISAFHIRHYGLKLDDLK